MSEHRAGHRGRRDAEHTGGGRFARNSLASLLRTVSGAFLAVLLPPLLVRRQRSAPMPTACGPSAVEMATYLALLDLGSISAVGHFVAHADPDAGPDAAGQVVATMLLLQVGLAAVGAVLLTALIWAMPEIFSRMPPALVPSGRWTMALVGGSALLGLLSTGLTGYFLTIHRVAVPASITFLTRLAGAIAVAVLAVTHHGIGASAVAWALTTSVGYAAGRAWPTPGCGCRPRPAWCRDRWPARCSRSPAPTGCGPWPT